MNAKPRILLFDIDGTLINSFGGGKTAILRTLESAFQLSSPDVEVSFGGRTDRSLVAEVLRRNGLADSPDHHATFHREYLRRLPDSLVDCGGEVCPGVRALVDRLAVDDRVFLAAMTGNYEASARLKLDHFGFAEDFEAVFGGDHDADRDDLARRAASRIARRFGPSAAARSVVIGDTVADVRCGRAIGAEVIAVCTGSGERQALVEAGADAVLADLSDTDRVFRLLTDEDASARGA